MSLKACCTCAYWDVAGSVGLCRRRAPISYLCGLSEDFEAVAGWPMTAERDWCGDWRSASAATTSKDSRTREAGKGRG